MAHNILDMPSRNTVRVDIADSYYHVYARGAAKAVIFRDDTDKDYFLYLISRHLSVDPVTNKQGYSYPHFRRRVELLTYCLMGNHYHLLFYQADAGALSELMKSVMVAYSVYFNRKYQRTGPLFENRFKASIVNKDAYLLHVSRYIHLNPRSWKYFPYSSLRAIRKANEPEWLQTEKLLDLYSSRKEYLEFVADYEENKEMLSELKHELANM